MRNIVRSEAKLVKNNEELVIKYGQSNIESGVTTLQSNERSKDGNYQEKIGFRLFDYHF